MITVEDWNVAHPQVAAALYEGASFHVRYGSEHLNSQDPPEHYPSWGDAHARATRILGDSRARQEGTADRPGEYTPAFRLLQAFEVAVFGAAAPGLLASLGLTLAEAKAAISQIRGLFGAAGIKAPDPVALATQGAVGVIVGLFLKKHGPLVATIAALVGAVLTLVGAGEASAVVNAISGLLGGFKPEIVGGFTAIAIVGSCAAIGRRFYTLGRKAFGPALPGEPTSLVAKWVWRLGGLVSGIGTVAVIVLGYMGQAQAATQVNGLLALTGGPDAELVAAWATAGPAALALLVYLKTLFAKAKAGQ